MTASAFLEVKLLPLIAFLCGNHKLHPLIDLSVKVSGMDRWRELKNLLHSVLDLGFDQGGGIPHQAEKGGGIWQLGGGMF